MEKSSFLRRLPLELISTLLHLLPRSDLLSLRLVSQSFLHLASPLVFSELTIKTNMVNDKHFHGELWLIKRLATSSSLISPSVRTLHIDSLFSPRYQRTAHGDGSYTQVFHDNEPGPDENIAKDIILEHLVPFLSKLQNLETFVWTHDPIRDPPAYLPLVANSISSLPKLQDLSVQIKLAHEDSSKYHLPQLHNFKNLSALSVASGNVTAAYCEDEIRPAIKASPRLGKFSLRLQKCYPIATVTTLLGKEPRPGLVDLDLKNVPFPSKGLGILLSKTLRHLNLSTRPGSRGTAVAWSSLWVGLRNAGVQLSSLSVSGFEGAVDDLFTYLLSYSTLERLSINWIQMDQAAAENAAGEIFWSKVVPHHKDHLIKLVVHPAYEGSWCYGPTPSVAIQQCLSLLELSLRVCQVDSTWCTDRVAQLREKGVEVPKFRDEWGNPAQCPVLVLSDVTNPLLELSISPTFEAKDREVDIENLNKGWRRKGSPYTYYIYQRLDKIRASMENILCGTTASSDGARNWPTAVKVNSAPLLKQKGKKKAGLEIWTYSSKNKK